MTKQSIKSKQLIVVMQESVIGLPWTEKSTEIPDHTERDSLFMIDLR